MNMHWARMTESCPSSPSKFMVKMGSELKAWIQYYWWTELGQFSSFPMCAAGFTTLSTSRIWLPSPWGIVMSCLISPCPALSFPLIKKLTQFSWMLVFPSLGCQELWQCTIGKTGLTFVSRLIRSNPGLSKCYKRVLHTAVWETTATVLQLRLESLFQSGLLAMQQHVHFRWITPFFMTQ